MITYRSKIYYKVTLETKEKQMSPWPSSFKMRVNINNEGTAFIR